MDSDKILQDILDLSNRSGVTNSQFRKEVESMVTIHLHGKDISKLSRKDRVKVMSNPTGQLDKYLKKIKAEATEICGED